jgi:gluconolactonase
VSQTRSSSWCKGGFGFTEGIVWVEKGRYLLFSDIPANVIYKLTPKGEASIYMQRSGYTKPDIWRVGFEQTNGKDPAIRCSRSST